MATQSILVERKDSVISVVLNDPKTRNALSPAILEELGIVLASTADDASISAVVISGSGGFFSAGGDLNQLAANRVLAPEVRMARIERLNALIAGLQAAPVPVIAAVEGGAAGAGMSLALACDMVVASRTAKFAVAYVKAGLTPDGGLTGSLAAVVSRQVLFELCALGAPLPAERMQAMGAVNQIVDEGEALNAALMLGARFARSPRRALGRIKQLSHAAYVNPFAEQLTMEGGLMVESQADEEAGEGIAAFLEKRAADFERLRNA
ncbi:oxepin-CoA hydrolase, alternative type [Cupriavidus sp. L7L]|uniref:oxepin-CoA hydrolase, alternative type n=1 Tax=Cupriavidus sp. L7L TaxID=2546443 RepID=UPI001055671C|nr:enoyl-CoA hydratase family protein [Cupriavidus sp. L7L]TDF64536.1 enoyl-CoA hydratase [Cupriavidus sp. L7L]